MPTPTADQNSAVLVAELNIYATRDHARVNSV
jgi:hypothetical protein